MSGPAYDPGEASHRALRGIRQELERHPAVSVARGFPEGEFTSVVAELDPAVVGNEDATLAVRWFAGEQPGADPEFSFHVGGPDADFGWHHEPNPHVKGWGHFQRREGSAYRYEPYSFSSLAPARVVWKLMARLTARLEE
ncbi:hypothetical protein [Halolamina salifodinae]|uniref:Uncharacterized protein n=1 Tax=Halolamina salifodinae TaxID=1202767 RepID=A0A8T4GVJ7_9EURY|nr:hypothetical protein [Halolamina salifodinae]MBP1987037.1 hypothetical protein [Halolamina salifodinae]